jgi:hypothetical protein
MKNDEDFMANASLGEKLEAVIENLPSTEVTLIEILDCIGDDSLLFLTIFLALVFLVPVSIPGVSTVFGTAILLIGVSRLLNRKLWLPPQIANRTIAAEKLTMVLNRALVWFRRLERLSRPYRFQLITHKGKIGLFNKLSFILAAVLLMAPFGFIPFSNTLPAIALIFLAIGVLQKDGVSLVLGHLFNLASIIYFLALIIGGGMTIYEVFHYIFG